MAEIRFIGCVELKPCPVCWGHKVICVGLDNELRSILKPCTGCDGTGWIAYKRKEEGNEH